MSAFFNDRIELNTASSALYMFILHAFGNTRFVVIKKTTPFYDACGGLSYSQTLGDPYK
jgi:hypothetical protein